MTCTDLANDIWNTVTSNLQYDIWWLVAGMVGGQLLSLGMWLCKQRHADS